MSAQNTEPIPGFELPPPPAGQTSEKGRGQAIEQGGRQDESTPRAPAQPVPAISAQQPTAPIQPPVLAPPAQDLAPPVAPTAHLPAEDSDLIEKEWVEKAKHIVSETHDDPHKQKDQISKVKADYIQKRFNKVIKTGDAAAL